MEIDFSIININFHFRPNASPGIWLSCLLFLAYLQTILRNPETIQLNYELSAVLLFGMFLQSLEIVAVLSIEKFSISLKLLVKLIPSFVTSTLLCLLLGQEIVFSCVTGLVVMTIYRFVYIHILQSLPFSFTLGEASIVSQAFIIFAYNCFLKLPFPCQSKDEMNVMLQVGLIGVFIIVISTHFLKIFRNSFMFYFLLVIFIAGVSIFPINNKFAFTILLDFVFSDLERILIVAVYVALLILAGLAVNWQISKNQRVTTSARKIFHILIVLVYVPGFIFQCNFLFVASVVILAIFIVLELARVIQLYPVAEVLERSVKAFIDEKDAGKVALTPIYLLVGCSLSIWIHNSPCDLTGSTSFEVKKLKFSLNFYLKIFL
jgi:dolichol kinase